MKSLYESILDTDFNGPSYFALKFENMLNKAYKRKHDRNDWFAYFSRKDMAEIADMVRKEGTLLDKTAVNKHTEPITEFDVYVILHNKSRISFVYRSPKDRYWRHDLFIEPEGGKFCIIRRYDESWSFSKDYKYSKGEVYSMPSDVCAMLQKFEKNKDL